MRDEVRVLGFQGEQLAQERVELSVADLRLVPHVVQVVVPVDLAPEILSRLEAAGWSVNLTVASIATRQW